MPSKSGRAWTTERSSVSRSSESRPRSNKYSGSDSGEKAASQRQRVWVGGYTRQDGTHVSGHYRSNNPHRG
jgi:hypothetical protein